MNEISVDELYEGLLAYGFFAEKIPPVFTSVPFYEYCKTITDPFPSGWNEYVSFRIMRNISVPRQMGIPNPFKYQRLCSILKENWNEIKEHFKNQTEGQQYKISRIHIRKKKGEKSIFEMNYDNWRVDGNPELDLLINDKGTSRYLVKADISACFPSIYTHAIPWALVGKDVSKRTVGDHNVWYNKIDYACSDMCNGETHGILIGPHSSNLLSEIILTRIDNKLYGKYRFIRNIDDYDCYVRSYDEAQRFLIDLEKELHEYDLLLNHKKTLIIDLPIGFEKDWKHQLSDLPRIGKYGVVEYPQINTFIDNALRLAKETGDFATINYAIKTIKGMNLSNNAKKLVAKRFMHMAVLYPYLLRLMEEYVFIPYEVEKDQIKSFADAIFKDAKEINNYESICYAIYFAIKYGFVLEEFETDYEGAQEYIFKGRDCLALTLTWIYYMKQNHWNRNATQVKPLKRMAFELKNTEIDRYWLFCYEALSFGCLDDEWIKMKQAGVSFIRSELIN